MTNVSYPLYLGKLNMGLEEFYDGIKSEENDDKYALCQMLVGIIDKYPPTTEKLSFEKVLDKIFYKMHNVDIAVCKSTLQKNSELQKLVDSASDIKIINNEEELVASGVYKVHLLKEDGAYQCNALLSKKLEDNVKKLPVDFSIGKEFYAMKAYSYACVIKDSKDLNDYDEIQDCYGKYIYAITLEHSNGKIGLTWLDFIMHRPQGHLEMGICARNCG